MDYGLNHSQANTATSNLYSSNSSRQQQVSVGFGMYPPPMAQQFHGQLTSQMVPPQMKGVDPNSPHCLLCLYPYPDTKLAPCQHHFHLKCMQRDFQNSPFCPICRQPIIAYEQSSDFAQTTKAFRQPGFLPIQTPLIPTAHQPASEDTLKARPVTNLRRGKWTPEEEAYANRLIQEFKTGYLPLTDGTTLRTFLSKLLNCDPMRISKKYVGSQCIGKQVFRRKTSEADKQTPEQIEKARQELVDLERRFLSRITQQKLKKEKKVNKIQTPTSLGSTHDPSITIMHTRHPSPVSTMEDSTDMALSEKTTPTASPPEAIDNEGQTSQTIEKNNSEEPKSTTQKEKDTEQEPASNNLSTANQNSYMPRIPSMDNLGMFSFPRVDSFDGLASFGFSRVPSFDNMLNLSSMGMSRTASVESLSSLCLPRVASMDFLCSAAASATNSTTKTSMSLSFPNGGYGKNSSQVEGPLSVKVHNTTGVPGGGLPRVPSLDKLSRPSSLLNLCSIAESNLPRVPSLERIAGNSNGALPRIPSTSSFGGMPRVSSIEDILSLVASSEAPDSRLIGERKRPATSDDSENGSQIKQMKVE